MNEISFFQNFLKQIWFYVSTSFDSSARQYFEIQSLAKLTFNNAIRGFLLFIHCIVESRAFL